VGGGPAKGGCGRGGYKGEGGRGHQNQFEYGNCCSCSVERPGHTEPAKVAVETERPHCQTERALQKKMRLNFKNLLK